MDVFTKPYITAFIFVLLALVILSLIGFIVAIRPFRLNSDVTPKNFGLAYQEITLHTKDHERIHAWFIPNPNPKAKAIILLHGYPADKGDILPGLYFLSRDFHLLFLDFRYFGKSTGAFTTIGMREVLDVKAATDFLRSQDIEEIGVYGFSMGGAVALMAAAQDPGIKAVVSEASYARLDLMAYEYYRFPIIRYPLGVLFQVWARVFLGHHLKDVSPLAAARQLQIPILVIHPQDDSLMKFEHAIMLQDALKHNPNAEFWFMEGVDHGEHVPGYARRIHEFFMKHLYPDE